jgi:mannose-1-phosphate guanylyltransferase
MLHSVIIAGGVGARFWPLSRKHRPKQLVDLLGEGPMIEQTIRRIEPMTPAEQRWIVTNREQMKLIRGVLPQLATDRFILEPVPRNTAPAIGLAAIHLMHKDPDAVMAVLPSDHRIEDVDEFRTVLGRAADLVAESPEALVTIGIAPTRPETGYGYIQVDQGAKSSIPDVFKVKTFAEKPTLQIAKSFLQSGEFLWNSGIFVWRADTIIRQIGEYLPQWYSGLREIGGAIGTEREAEVTKHVFSALKGISIDYGVMEHAPHVAVVRGGFGWSDVGSWDEVWRLLPRDQNGIATRGDVVSVDSADSLILAQDRLIALVGVNDLIVVDAGDAILICPREKSQNVRALVEALEKSGHKKHV